MRRPVPDSAWRTAIVVCGIWLFESSSAIAATWPDEREIWTRVDSPSFSVYTNAGAERAEETARDLEVLREVIWTLLQTGGIESPPRTTVFLFRNRTSFQPYRDAVIGRRNAKAAGVFVAGDGRNYIAAASRSGRDRSSVVFHEFVHDFLSTWIPAAPLWFNEGLGEFFSTLQYEDDLATAGLPVRSHLQRLAAHDRLPIESLLAMTPDWDGYFEGSRNGVFYAQSWALTHYFFVGGGDRRVLQRYLEAIDASPNPDETPPPLVISVEQLEWRLDSYVRQRNFNYLRVPLSQRVDEIELVTERVSRDELLYELGNLLFHSSADNVADAAAHYREALRTNPRHAGAHGILGTLFYVEGRKSEAARHFAAATEALTTDYLPWLLHGENLLERIRGRSIGFDRAEPPPPPELVRARAMFERSIELNPDDPRAWAGLGATYLYETSVTAAGIDALNRSLELQPDAIDVVIHLIVLHLKADHRAIAHEIYRERLLPSANREMIEVGQRALAAWDVSEAGRLAARGRLDEARSMLERAISIVEEPGLERKLRNDLQNIDAVLEFNRLVSLYNEAVQAANNYEYARAIEILDRLESQTNDRELQNDVSHLRRTVEEFIKASERSKGAR